MNSIVYGGSRRFTTRSSTDYLRYARWFFELSTDERCTVPGAEGEKLQS